MCPKFKVGTEQPMQGTMVTCYRIYLGARNTPNHAFLHKDEIQMRGLLNRYFQGWTIVSAEGEWDGQREESRIITVTDSALRTNIGNVSVESFTNELKEKFKQYLVMQERGGVSTFL